MVLLRVYLQGLLNSQLRNIFTRCTGRSVRGSISRHTSIILMSMSCACIVRDGFLCSSIPLPCTVLHTCPSDLLLFGDPGESPLDEDERRRYFVSVSQPIQTSSWRDAALMSVRGAQQDPPRKDGTNVSSSARGYTLSYTIAMIAAWEKFSTRSLSQHRANLR